MFFQPVWLVRSKEVYVLRLNVLVFIICISCKKLRY